MQQDRTSNLRSDKAVKTTKHLPKLDFPIIFQPLFAKFLRYMQANKDSMSIIQGREGAGKTTLLTEIFLSELDKLDCAYGLAYCDNYEIYTSAVIFALNQILEQLESTLSSEKNMAWYLHLHNNLSANAKQIIGFYFPRYKFDEATDKNDFFQSKVVELYSTAIQAKKIISNRRNDALLDFFKEITEYFSKSVIYLLVDDVDISDSGFFVFLQSLNSFVNVKVIITCDKQPFNVPEKNIFHIPMLTKIKQAHYIETILSCDEKHAKKIAKYLPSELTPAELSRQIIHWQSTKIFRYKTEGWKVNIKKLSKYEYNPKPLSPRFIKNIVNNLTFLQNILLRYLVCAREPMRVVEYVELLGIHFQNNRDDLNKLLISIGYNPGVSLSGVTKLSPRSKFVAELLSGHSKTLTKEIYKAIQVLKYIPGFVVSAAHLHFKGRLRLELYLMLNITKRDDLEIHTNFQQFLFKSVTSHAIGRGNLTDFLNDILNDVQSVTDTGIDLGKLISLLNHYMFASQALEAEENKVVVARAAYMLGELSQYIDYKNIEDYYQRAMDNLPIKSWQCAFDDTLVINIAYGKVLFYQGRAKEALEHFEDMIIQIKQANLNNKLEQELAVSKVKVMMIAPAIATQRFDLLGGEKGIGNYLCKQTNEIFNQSSLLEYIRQARVILRGLEMLVPGTYINAQRENFNTFIKLGNQLIEKFSEYNLGDEFPCFQAFSALHIVGNFIENLDRSYSHYNHYRQVVNGYYSNISRVLSKYSPNYPMANLVIGLFLFPYLGFNAEHIEHIFNTALKVANKNDDRMACAFLNGNLVVIRHINGTMPLLAQFESANEMQETLQSYLGSGDDIVKMYQNFMRSLITGKIIPLDNELFRPLNMCPGTTQSFLNLLKIKLAFACGNYDEVVKLMNKNHQTLEFIREYPVYLGYRVYSSLSILFLFIGKEEQLHLDKASVKFIYKTIRYENLIDSVSIYSDLLDLLKAVLYSSLLDSSFLRDDFFAVFNQSITPKNYKQKYSKKLETIKNLYIKALFVENWARLYRN